MKQDVTEKKNADLKKNQQNSEKQNMKHVITESKTSTDRLISNTKGFEKWI